jgi:hypothetical protein
VRCYYGLDMLLNVEDEEKILDFGGKFEEIS